jgi:hypothetical protein
MTRKIAMRTEIINAATFHLKIWGDMTEGLISAESLWKSYDFSYDRVTYLLI